ncbi:MAG: STAS-like domain-containing protein [Peptoniphilus sp.]|uniref:STAS-like domain-containing protein n=1 Tax=Peptoniphilus sp. TaxID=1971214 RepID=UPI002A761CD2|nr:STAS-like domain-containing protein [Peptoniphilus sp.]MDY2987159.1 STAS-like domain-containing protein [Peptoniphilus sp.]
MNVNVKEFTTTPGGRYKQISSFSGEEFRDDILRPAIEEAINKGENIVINLDGTYGYPTSFLDEAFGKLCKYFTNNELKKITYISNDEPSLIQDIEKYTKNNR